MSDVPNLHVKHAESGRADQMLASLLLAVFGLDQYVLVAVGECETHNVRLLNIHSGGLTADETHLALVDAAASTSPVAGT